MSLFSFVRPLLFLLPAERAHYATLKLLKAFLAIPGVSSFFEKRAKNAIYNQPVKVAGITFKNPIGLAAGFDKNALFINELHLLGFGFIEIGTVTPKPQSGNPKPRLFRLKQDNAVINRMGFNNDGVEAIAKRLENNQYGTIIGGNIGKNKSTPNERAVEDYLICFKRLFGLVDYFVVNVSSPNTPGLRELQEKDSLNKILGALQDENEKHNQPKPLFLKIAPDLSDQQLNEILDIVQANRLTGIICNNTTISRSGLATSNTLIENIGAGGLSGAPLKHRSREVLEHLCISKASSLALVSSGGIDSYQEASHRIGQGATLVQVYTGFIYQGPSIIRRFLKDQLKRKA